VTIQDIGGKFAEILSAGNDEIFGAVVRVSSRSDTPNLTTNLLGSTLLSVGINDAENDSGPLSLALTPGWYALGFGSGRFGATGGLTVAVETLNGQQANTTNGDATYAIRQSDGQVFPQAPGSRYFAEGWFGPAASAVPEPASLTLLATGALGLAGYGWRRRRQAG
jgi:hypothetical protein